MGLGSNVLNAATAGPLAVGKALSDILGNLDHIASGVTAMNDHFTAMRGEIAELNDHVVELRDQMAAVRGDVSAINGKWDVLDVRIEELAVTLGNVDALASRFARFGKRAS
jgi:hypothetical protein